MPLVIPYPYSNLLRAQDIQEVVGQYTDDIVVYPDGGSFVIASTEVLAEQIPSPPRTFDIAERRGSPRQPGTPGGQPPSPRTTGAYTVNAPLAKEAEDYVERLLRGEHADAVRRIGHTSDELVPLPDGLLPGADLLVELAGNGVNSIGRYVEVKSSHIGNPRSIRLTASELQRAIKCSEENIPFDVYVVIFSDNDGAPELAVLADFQVRAAGLGVADFEGFELGIALNS